MKLALVIFFCGVIIVFGGLLGRLVYLNESKGASYKKEVLSQQSYVNKVLKYRRGEIKDRNDTTLAISKRVFNVILEPGNIKDTKYYEDTIQALQTYLNVDKATMDQLIADKPNSLYESLDALKGLSQDQIQPLKEAMSDNKKIKGIQFEEDYVRSYPLSTVACSLVGFASKDNTGSYGIEESFNDELNGTEGREYGYFDSNLNLQRTVKDATNGNNVVMTVDSNVQEIVEQQIARFMTKTGAENVAVVMMNCKTGEIYSMASNKTFDLNNPRDLSAYYTADQIAAMSDEDKTNALSSMWSNYCISSAYEPGSTFKPFTVAAALDEKKVTDNSSFVCDGYEDVAGQRIRCVNRNGHGPLTLEQSLMESCNDALIHIGLSLGRTKFYNYNRLYGFGQKTGVTLPGENAGLLHDKDGLNPVELATSSFGQTQTVTMVQMIAGFCSLMNGGNYYQPQIVKAIENEDGTVVESNDPVFVKKTTTEKTSRLLRKYMLATVESGTATAAQVKGYSIGGKTGTAQKRPVTAKNYLVSFIGAVPMNDPEVAIYVVVDQPHVSDQAHSTYASELASRILKRTLPFLGVYKETDTKTN